MLANLWLVLGATQVHADELWTESSFRLLLAFAALSWLLLLVAAFRLKRRLAQWCVWLCNGCLAGAVLFR